MCVHFVVSELGLGNEMVTVIIAIKLTTIAMITFRTFSCINTG